MRRWFVVSLLLACARRSTATPVGPTESTPPAHAAPANLPPLPADPLAALRQRLPEDRDWYGDLVKADNRSLWSDLDRTLHALAPGPARDELLRLALAAVADWADADREAPTSWSEAWVSGAGPFGWPLARAATISSMPQARALLQGDALAQITRLSLFLDASELCDRPDELFDLLAAAKSLGRIDTLWLRLPACVPAATLSRLAALPAPALRRLILPEWVGPRSAAVLAGIPLFARLDEIDLSNSHPQRDGLAALARSPHLRKLRVLRLRRSLDTTDAALALADTPAWTGLRELDLSGNVLTRAALEGLGRNPALADLEVLDISRSRGPDEDRLTGFARAGGLPGLRVLRVDGSGLSDAGLSAIVTAKRWSKLRELDLSGTGIGPNGAAIVARATGLVALEHISLAGARIGPAGGRALADAPHLARLRHLDLTRCEIGARAATSLLTRLERPETLLLSGNAIDDAGAVVIAGRRDWTGLRTLELGGNQIGDDGATALATAPQLAALEKFGLAGNPLNERGWRALVESRPLARFVQPRWRRELALRDTTLGPEDAARTIAPDLAISLTRRGCFGECPVFTVSVHADGRLEYRGARHVKVEGPVQDRVDAARVRLILAALDKFLATEPERYPARSGGCSVLSFDNENVAVRVHRDGRTREFDSESICPTAPARDEIFRLADRMSALLATDRWTRNR